MAMSLWLGVPLTTTLSLAVAGVASFYLWAFARRLVTGNERLILLEHVWVAFGAAALVLWIAGLPTRSSLDVFSVGLGTFLAFARIGCLQVGCCHGTPGRIGIRYGHGFGLSSRLATHRLVPVQLYESVGIAAITVGRDATGGASTRNSHGLVSLWRTRVSDSSPSRCEAILDRGFSASRCRERCASSQFGVGLALADRWLVEGITRPGRVPRYHRSGHRRHCRPRHRWSPPESADVADPSRRGLDVDHRTRQSRFG